MGIQSNTAEFSVCQFFADGTYEYVSRYVEAEEAVPTASGLCTSPKAIMGLVVRVIITDGGDCITLEWERDKGITFPPEMKGHPSFPAIKLLNVMDGGDPNDPGRA